ncbi:MAG: hypothetical protein WBP37_05110 [Candidatus Dechloromonas phosphoritropha]
MPSPRELMRARHPDLFSDTMVVATPKIATSVFEYHLETLTSRKQEYEFEHFCRKIAECEICPNLRVQTGPTGGGDSKVDSETYPVAAEIAERWWFGEPSGGSERWAFAFSAKKAWKTKVRADVKNILSTGRDYKRIYFFTNQFASDKERAKLEDDLSRCAGVPVHIVDRSWLVERVYRHDHLDLAIATLCIIGAGESTEHRRGPLDTERLSEIEVLDKEISDPSRYEGARYQLVEDCLQGALLARGLNRPRYEVDGRFAQAERLGKDMGIPQQLMRVAYNRAWTAYWWFEDYEAFSKFYSEVEEHLGDSTDADDVSRLLNLWQILITAESLELIKRELAQSEARRKKLHSMLQGIAGNTSRPNNALQARTSLALLRAAHAMNLRDLAELDRVWEELARVVDESAVMGQYPVERLADIVHVLGDIADGKGFDALYTKVIDAMQQRRSDGVAGIAYRDRGLQKLGHDKPYEAIRWIGKAEELLVKEEYQGELVMTLVAASFAYERAGLLWAARNKVLVAAERCFHLFAKSGEMPPATLRILQRLAWIELQLGRVPHVLQAMSWSSFTATHLKLSDERKALHSEEVQMQEAVLGILFLNLSLEQLSDVESLPDALKRLGLANARLALLYALGHEKRIYAEKYFSAENDSEWLPRFFENWQEQPAAADLPEQASLIGGAKTSLRSVILGAEFLVVTPSEPTFLGVAESLLGALEAFLATSDETDLLPHVERTTIIVLPAAELEDKPSFQFTPGKEASAEIRCPPSLAFSSVEAFHGFTDWLRDTVISIALHQFIVRDPKEWLDRVAGDERAFARAILLGDMLTIGRNAFGHVPNVRLRDWIDPDDKIYECLRDRPWRTPNKACRDNVDVGVAPKFGNGQPPAEFLDSTSRKHTERQVMSPIDMQLWNKAQWCGTLFAMADRPPPILGLLYRDLEAGIAIFRAWGTKWGRADVRDALRIVIVTGVSKQHPAHYSLLIGPSITDEVAAKTKVFVSVSRINRMTPETTTNLDQFLTIYRQHGEYLLVPAGMNNPPQLEMGCFLAKKQLHVRPAWEIGENDPDASVLQDDDDPIVPAGVTDPPVKKALERMRSMRLRRGTSVSE